MPNQPIPYGTWPDFHPTDTTLAGSDQWRPGNCDSCDSEALVVPAPCGADDCTGCRRLCLSCEEKRHAY